MSPKSNPLVYEINTRVWLRGRTLADVSDAELDQLAGLGVDFVWLMGVWTTGEAGRALALELPELRAAYDEALPGWTPDDVLGSPYAVADYHVSPALGGPDALAALRERLAARKLGLILDFVGNHVARDNAWTASHPEYFVRRADGSPEFGRDPYFPPWTDTAQLEHGSRALRAALIDVLEGIAAQCDGVRCDMAMLMLRDVFARTWSASPPPPDPVDTEFWAEAIPAVRAEHPAFLFLAEAYWDLEWTLQELGFDYTYDKRLYDRLRDGAPGPIRAHLRADEAYQRRSCRFVENHDEPRAAAVWGPEQARAAAAIALTVPGMRLVHDGQLEGRRRRLPVQLGRRADELVDGATRGFYEWLLARRLSGTWRLLEIDGSVLAWERGDTTVVVNYGGAEASFRGLALAPWQVAIA